MNLEPNHEPPEIMHIDLNSAFAMTEQQANPLLRHKPVGVTNRLNDFAICIAASYEAKRAGIGLGVRQREAKQLAPNFVMVEADPAKYMFVHKKLKAIFESYSPVAYMKSIDEGIIDFTGQRRILKGRSLQDIALEIKQRIKEEVGDYMTVNTGIATNRWLAKVAAGFMKPDGLYTIDHSNLELTYSLLELTDLPYIKARNRARLNLANIYTTLDFYQASEHILTKQVFKSVNGHHWYLKLRGYETEVQFGIRTVGRSYVLEHRTADPTELATLFYKAAVKLSRRMASKGLAARGLMLSLGYAKQYGRHHELLASPRGWYSRQMYNVTAHRGDQLFSRMLDLFNRSPQGLIVSSLMVTAYALEPTKTNQPALFDDRFSQMERIETAVNQVNDRYGELTVAPATVIKSKNPMKDKIPFGSIRYFE